MWNERYSEPGFVYGTAPNDFLVASLGRLPRGRILSLAEGEGRNAVYLAEQGYDVVAVDSSDVGLKKAEQLAVQHGVAITTVVADLGDYRIEPESWDGIISIYCHVPSELRAMLHKEVVRGLKQGGVFILEAFSPRQLHYGTGGPSSLDLLMPLEDVKNELAGLSLLHAVEVEREVREGSRHTGLAAVIQVVGVKK